MNINRYNYEAFFLLYVDNELSAAERKTVDVFVQENPDLQEELLMLQQTIINPDTILFENKNALLKEEVPFWQEQLLLLADNELGPVGSQKIAALIATNSTVAAEWNVLQKTKLQPETVVFADKRSLYRHEGARVVAIKWWRVAAAAILLGLVTWTSMSIYRNSSKTTTGTATAKNNTAQPQPVNSTANNNMVSPENSTVAKDENVTSEEVTTSTVKDKIKQQPVDNSNRPAEKLPVPNANNIYTKQQSNNNTAQQSPNNRQTNNLPKSYLENINSKERNETIAYSVTPKNEVQNTNPGINNTLVQTNPKEKTNSPVVTDVNMNGADAKNNTAVPVAYNKTTAETNDRYLDTDDDNTKRSKVGGFLRKVKRLIERNTSIKTGNEVKVAGFEIAIK